MTFNFGFIIALFLVWFRLGRVFLLCSWLFKRLWLLERGHSEADLVDPTIKLLGGQVCRLWLLAVKIPEAFVDHLVSIGGDADLLGVLG